MLELLFAWLTGTAVLVGSLSVITAIGYGLRMIIPVEKWNSPLKYPSFELDRMDVLASLIVGFIAVVVILVPLIVGAGILA